MLKIYGFGARDEHPVADDGHVRIHARMLLGLVAALRKQKRADTLAPKRCAETAKLDVHRRVPFALGGPHDASSLELRCRAHNELAAEQDFGRDHMANRRGELRPQPMVPRWRGSTHGAGRSTDGTYSVVSRE